MGVSVEHGRVTPLRAGCTNINSSPLGSRLEFAERVVDSLRRDRGIEPGESVAQSPFEHDLAVVGAFGGQLAGGDLGTVQYPPAEAFEPGEGGVFDDGFGEAAHSECLVVGLGACSLSFSTDA